MSKHPTFKALGWVSEETLTDLLVSSKAVISPQLYGMGALTKLPELSCAGIPVLTSNHACYALDLPPGITGLPNSWEAWQEAIEKCLDSNPQNQDLYESWLSRQGDTLSEEIRKILD